MRANLSRMWLQYAILVSLAMGWLFFSVVDRAVSSYWPRGMASVGRDYRDHLGRAYATAWRDGAFALESGLPMSSAIAAVGRSWEAERARIFDGLVLPEFTRIAPGFETDADLTPGQRADMIRAWREFADGLDSR